MRHLCHKLARPAAADISFPRACHADNLRNGALPGINILADRGKKRERANPASKDTTRDVSPMHHDADLQVGVGVSGRPSSVAPG